MSEAIRTSIARTRLFELYTEPRTFDGRSMTFEFVRRPPGVRVLIPNMKDRLILLTREFREESEGWDYRLPGGKLFDTLDQYDAFQGGGGDLMKAANDQALAEVQQEAGLIVGDLDHIHSSRCGASVDWTLHYFVANTIVACSQQNLDPGERVEPTWVSFTEAFDFAIMGRMQEDRSVSVLLRWLHANGG